MALSFNYCTILEDNILIFMDERCPYKILPDKGQSEDKERGLSELPSGTSDSPSGVVKPW